MIAILLILIPLFGGLAGFFFNNEKTAKSWSLFLSVLVLIISVLGLTLMKEAKWLEFHREWMGSLGSSFSIRLDGMGQILCLLTAIAYPLVFCATWKTQYTRPSNFFALMLLSQAGLMGVFLAMDALLFYFFWELALIPMYFLCSQWGGPKRIAVTFKFFIYTFIGSVLMLIGILYVYSQTADHSFSIASFYNTKISDKHQSLIFWLFFIAFAIKMPIFPFHTWQPDTYEQSPPAVTMILSGVMVKMGLLGLIRWLLPVLSIASYRWGDSTMTLCVAGMIYASLIAIRQDDLRRLVAYSSIAHMGLMCAAVFSENASAMQGVMIQIFNHGINIIGLWIVVDWIERKTGTRKISELGGLAQKAPAMTMMLVMVVLANLALPLTNAFAGEFLMFNGLLGTAVTKYYIWFTVLAGFCIILAAVYLLNMVRKVFYGSGNTMLAGGAETNWNEMISLGIIVLLVLWIGFQPQSLLNVTKEFSDGLLMKSDVLHAAP